MGFFNRIKCLRQVDLLGDSSQVLISKATHLVFAEGAKVKVEQGVFSVGYPLPDRPELPALNKSTIQLGKNARLICRGNVFIGEGTYIRLADNAVMEFDGDNVVGRNSILFCETRMHFGRRASCSWGVTLMDDDGHSFARSDGTPLRKIRRPLVLESDVGVQMNVTIPKGITVGHHATISANTTVRRDIKPFSLVYEESALREREGIVFRV